MLRETIIALTLSSLFSITAYAQGANNSTPQAAGAGRSDQNANQVSGQLGNQGNNKAVGNAGGAKGNSGSKNANPVSGQPGNQGNAGNAGSAGGGSGSQRMMGNERGSPKAADKRRGPSGAEKGKRNDGRGSGKDTDKQRSPSGAGEERRDEGRGSGMGAGERRGSGGARGERHGSRR